MENEQLYHHGIKGQRWGIRRYQNKDGSLTKAGEKRYANEWTRMKKAEAAVKQEAAVLRNKKKTQSKIDKLNAKKDEISAKRKAIADESKEIDEHLNTTSAKERNFLRLRKQKQEETVEEKRERLLKSVDAAEIYKNKDILSNEEINDRINRIDLEARLQSRVPVEKKKTAYDYVDDMIKAYKTVDNIYGTVSGSAMGKALAKKMGLDVDPKENKKVDIAKLYKDITDGNATAKQIREGAEAVRNIDSIKKSVESDRDNANKKQDDSVAVNLKEFYKNIDNMTPEQIKKAASVAKDYDSIAKVVDPNYKNKKQNEDDHDDDE